MAADPIQLDSFIHYMEPAFLSFVQHWPDDGHERPKLVATTATKALRSTKYTYILLLLLNYTFTTCAGAVTHMGGQEVHTGFWWGYLWERDRCDDQDVEGMIILKWII